MRRAQASPTNTFTYFDTFAYDVLVSPTDGALRYVHLHNLSTVGL